MVGTAIEQLWHSIAMCSARLPPAHPRDIALGATRSGRSRRPVVAGANRRW
jgi:hypothetical protein